MIKQTQLQDRSWTTLFLAWVVASVATGGSLFFSEVMEYAPCLLCWYQRICMYPLVLIYASAMLSHDQKSYYYSAPLITFGWVIAFYHNLLQWEIIPENASPCRAGLSCADKWIEWFGFISIPVLSLVAFSLLAVFSFLSYRRNIK
jgi:disulfide bond formation protein DsbB